MAPPIPDVPAARKLAQQHPVDSDSVTGTGPTGSVTLADVERAIAAAATPRRALSGNETGYRGCVSDGHRGARFLVELGELLQHPEESNR
ncbi:hypothetical protein WS75_13890 [Burkholderia sp. FL-7-2-10-S1-D7]|uniref:E3 binding domain-containing protein n=1 Tax=Burkholderia sp. FL-7-2-10-S1-D7 TaxID=1637866 RepID=UPI00075DBFC0|nr:E3 binding domain-containing protein [Burkholderia sp. FL-7-2-10-S1-D7]KVF75896.1 hypothetical protein WS75_13890 [Burkholderia sp. FL-7-2-10-S1-D7]